MKIEDITLQDIYDFMEHGSLENAPPGIAEYLELLDKVRGMLLRIDQFANDESIIKHLMLVDGISRYKAKNIIAEAREYFYKDAVVSKMAWRNIYAEKLDKVIHFAMLNMKDINDASKISKMILDIITVEVLMSQTKRNFQLNYLEDRLNYIVLMLQYLNLEM